VDGDGPWVKMAPTFNSIDKITSSGGVQQKRVKARVNIGARRGEPELRSSKQ